MSNEMNTQSSIGTYDLGGIPIVEGTLEHAVEVLGERARGHQGGSAYFVNVHTWTLAQEDEGFLRLFQRAAYCFPDGKPLVWLAQLRGGKTVTRICGPDFTPLFIKHWGSRLTWGCIGGEPGQVEQLGKHFNTKITGHSPPHRVFSPENAQEDWKKFLTKFQSEHGLNQVPHVVMVCLGAPKQELWIDEIVKIAPKSILFLGVGAALDFLTGAKNRAPQWMRKSGLEWLHRLSSEPKRLGERYFKTNLKFLKYVSKK